MFSLSSPQEERAGERRPLLLNAPLPVPTAIKLRSADFSPPRSGPAKTAGSGLKFALLSCCNSLNSMAVLLGPLLQTMEEREFVRLLLGRAAFIRVHSCLFVGNG